MMEEKKLFAGFRDEEQAVMEKEAMQVYDPEIVKASNRKWKNYKKQKILDGKKSQCTFSERSEESLFSHRRDLSLRSRCMFSERIEESLSCPSQRSFAAVKMHVL
jgi:hypothetical protein